EPEPARRVASDPSPAPLATGSPRQALEPARTAEPRAQTASRGLPLGLAGLAIVVISSLAPWYFVGRRQATPAPEASRSTGGAAPATRIRRAGARGRGASASAGSRGSVTAENRTQGAIQRKADGEGRRHRVCRSRA